MNPTKKRKIIKNKKPTLKELEIQYAHEYVDIIKEFTEKNNEMTNKYVLIISKLKRKYKDKVKYEINEINEMKESLFTKKETKKSLLYDSDIYNESGKKELLDDLYDQ